MPPLRALDDETIAGAPSPRSASSWGHKCPADFHPATICRGAQRRVGDREAPWSEEELQDGCRKPPRPSCRFQGPAVLPRALMSTNS